VEIALVTSFSLKELNMTRLIRWYDYITFNVFFFGLQAIWQTMGLVTPLLVEQFVGETQKATYLGRLRLFSLMFALLAQALMGMFSDRSTLPLGRRRPFIAVGTLFSSIFIILVGFTAGLEGISGYWVLFAVVILLQVASNTAQAGEQGIIPDLIPEEKRGRFSGVKALFEIPLPLIVVAFTVGKLVSKEQYWAALGIVLGALIISMLLTMLVPEKPLEEKPPAIDWTPFIRLFAMTVVFTLIIWGSGKVVEGASGLLQDISSPTAIFIVMGLVGLLGMLIAVGMGVWLSVRISLGDSAREHPSFTWWVINRLAFLVGVVNLSTFAVYFLQARLGYEKAAAAAPASKLLMFVGIFILISTVPAGWLTDRFGEKRMVSLSGIMAVVGTVIALSIPSLMAIYMGGCIIGIAAGFFYSSNWALGTLLVPRAEAGRYLGISNLAGAGAGAVGAYIGGPIADFVTAQVPQVPGFGYVLIFSIYGLLFLFSVIALRQVKTPR
jgi:MFS family permease